MAVADFAKIHRHLVQPGQHGPSELGGVLAKLGLHETSMLEEGTFVDAIESSKLRGTGTLLRPERQTLPRRQLRMVSDLEVGYWREGPVNAALRRSFLEFDVSVCYVLCRAQLWCCCASFWCCCAQLWSVYSIVVFLRSIVVLLRSTVVLLCLVLVLLCLILVLQASSRPHTTKGRRSWINAVSPGGQMRPHPSEVRFTPPAGWHPGPLM